MITAVLSNPGAFTNCQGPRTNLQRPPTNFQAAHPDLQQPVVPVLGPISIIETKENDLHRNSWI